MRSRLVFPPSNFETTLCFVAPSLAVMGHREAAFLQPKYSQNTAILQPNDLPLDLRLIQERLAKVIA